MAHFRAVEKVSACRFYVNVNHHLMRWIAWSLSSLRGNGLLHRVRP